MNNRKKDFKELFKEGIDWVRIHPRATFGFCFSFFIFFAFLMGFVIPLLKQSRLITNSEVPNPFTYDQLTGLVILLFAIIMLGIGYFAMRFFLRLSNELIGKDEKEHTKKSPV